MTMAEIRSYAAFTAPNRAELLSAMAWPPAYDDGGADQQLPPFIRVVLPCGSIREWWRPEQVPDFSVECHCGNLPYEHFFIKYDRSLG